tara:strand:+ start:544 stop:882 length:339 start_codon:yes stop_codon:yes gene_type:complete
MKFKLNIILIIIILTIPVLLICSDKNFSKISSSSFMLGCLRDDNVKSKIIIKNLNINNKELIKKLFSKINGFISVEFNLNDYSIDILYDSSKSRFMNYKILLKNNGYEIVNN